MWAVIASAPILYAVDTNPDTPSSILAAVIFLGGVMLSGLLYDRAQTLKRHDLERAESVRERQDLQKKVDELQAAAVNRERQLGQEIFPIVKQTGTVLEAVQQGMAFTLQQARTSSGTPDPAVLKKLSDFIDAIQRREPT